jgi:hypothetical protein
MKSEGWEAEKTIYRDVEPITVDSSKTAAGLLPLIIP